MDDYSFIQKELVLFFFNSFRKTNKDDIIFLEQHLHHVLSLLKTNIHANGDAIVGQTWIPYLKKFYQLMAHTRDQILGKGEHDITYMMIRVWYQYFPALAIYFIFSLVSDDFGFYAKDHVNESNRILALGSWRDMKYLCLDVSEHKSNASIITYCISIMNKQLKHDIDNVKRGVFPISKVAKWIPRENSRRFGWLFTELVIDFFKTYQPYLLKDPNIRAINKCKMLYRKYLSQLNSIIDTTQIKQCSRDYKSIMPESVSKYTLMKQPKLYTDDAIACHDNFKRFLSKKYGLDDRGDGCGDDLDSLCINVNPVKMHLPVAYYIKQAFELLKLKKSLGDGFSIADFNYKVKILNKQWNLFSKCMSLKMKHDHYIPLVDVSESMRAFDSESFYTGIGLAILFSKNSFFKNRILAVDHSSTWIHCGGEDHDANDDLFNMIETIDQQIVSSSSTQFDIKKAINFLVYAIQCTKLNLTNIDKIKIVIFSDFSKPDNYYEIIKKQFSLRYILNVKSFHMPSLIFWNLSKTGIVDLPCPVDQSKTMVLSGLSQIFDSDVAGGGGAKGCGDINPYIGACNILGQNRYRMFDTYIDKIVNHDFSL